MLTALKWARKASECGYVTDPPAAWQLLNHIQNAHELVTKSGLGRNLRALARLDGVDTSAIAPPTYHAGLCRSAAPLLPSLPDVPD